MSHPGCGRSTGSPSRSRASRARCADACSPCQVERQHHVWPAACRVEDATRHTILLPFAPYHPKLLTCTLAHGHVGKNGWLRPSRGVRLPRWRVGPRPYRRGALPPRARVRLQPLCQRMEVRLPLLLGPVRRRAATERLAAQHAVPLAAQQLQPAPLLRAALLLPVCATRRAARHRDGRRLVHRPALHLEP